ncbi:membrane traffic protein [Lithospermum erythrorhizon]|uniref:Reticulon-like protein n=1 Tax=Lithospermum erythrorhizon TaxID=34254 RepID=A0AAV3QN69_LITER
MGDHSSDNDSFIESVTEKITEKFHGHDSSPSDSDDEDHHSFSMDSVKANVYRMFGREKPVHKVFGGGKAADIFLWREKKVTGSVVGVTTAIWVLFELFQYHLLTLVCHLLLLSLVVMFLWSHASTFIKKSIPKIPQVVLPEDIVLDVAAALRVEINRAFFIIREIALGKDLKKFLCVITGLWIVSVFGSCFSFLTLFYISFLLLHTVPIFYETYEDQVDAFAEKAEAEIKKQFAVYLSKLPEGIKDKLA